MDYEPGLCDLVRAIDLTLIAPVEPEVALRLRAVTTLRLALECAHRPSQGRTTPTSPGIVARRKARRSWA
jgi:hypothetical protein